MTSLTSDPSKMDQHYQSSDTSDHGLLSHHTCTCCRECLETPETPKTEHPRHPLPSPHHHVVNLSHTPLQMTHHVHLNHHNHHHGAAVPPPTASPKPQVKNCTCHLKTENEAEERQNIEPNAQGRKLDEDRIEVSPLPPALPPRPPPRARYEGAGSLNSRYRPRIGE